MTIASAKEMLLKASKEKYAVGAFNMTTSFSNCIL